jgi:hypothetical protein
MKARSRRPTGAPAASRPDRPAVLWAALDQLQRGDLADTDGIGAVFEILGS